MANPAKAAGSRWELDLRRYFQSLGLPACKATQDGRPDVGDLHGLDPFIGQAKAWENTTAALRVGTDGAQKQARHAGRDYGVNFVKRARASTSNGYAITPIRVWALVLIRLRRAEDLLAVRSPEDYRAHLEQTREERLTLGA